MQVNLIFILTGQTASGEQEVLGAFDTTGWCRSAANDTWPTHGNPYTSFTIKPTVLDYPGYGGDMRSLQWDDSTNQWELA
jgi:hypothetical protein